MAIDIEQEFGTLNTNPATPEFPNGSYKNETVPNVSQDGTPVTANTLNDELGFTEALLAAAGLTANGTVDTALSSQRLDALRILIGKDALRPVLISQGLSGNYGFFADGFAYNVVGDVGIDTDGKIYTYAGSDPLPVSVAPATDPVGNSDYFRFYNGESPFISANLLGFVYDGTTDNLSAFNFAKSILPQNGLGIDFNEKGSIYISSNRPDLSGIKIRSNDSCTIKVDQNPNVKEMDLYSDLTIENTAHERTLIKHKNKSNDYLIAAGAAISELDYSQPEKIEFTSNQIELASITGIKTKGAFTGSATSTIINWSGGFATGQEGLFTHAEQGAYYEVAVRHTGTASSVPSSRRSASVITPTQRIDFSIYVGVAQWTLIDSSSGVIEQGVTPNGGAYALSDFGALTLGVRVLGRLAEFYINSTLIATYEMDVTPNEIGFLASSAQSSNCQFNNLTKQSSKKLNSSSPTTIAIVGDSISYGAWASYSYDSIIKKTMYSAGLGDVETVNYAVSGSSTNAWIPSGSIDIDTVDLTSSEYTLVMLGTNDVQGGTAGLTFESNLRTIISRIQAQGSKPIVGVFPLYTTEGVSGFKGVTTSNYAKGGWHRQLVKWVCADLGIPVAEVCESFGTNIELLGDNIHPTEKGQILIASAFVKAILGDKGSSKIKSKSEKLQLSGSWVKVGASSNPVVTSKDNNVCLTGAVNGGSVGSTILSLGVDYRPSRTKTFVCAITNSGAAGFAHVRVEANGKVILNAISEAAFDLLWLDGVVFSPEA